jgi:DNA-binding NarL/FixJ family response regulator
MTKTITKVFIADDHPIVLLGVKQMLASAENKDLVGEASSSHELFKALPEVRPDVLLLDLNMPGNDYQQTIQLLQTKFPQLKIIIYTAYNAPDLIKSLEQSGVHGFLLKTAAPSTIHEAIEKVMAGEYYSYVKDRAYQPPSDEQPGPGLKDNFRKRLKLSKREQEILVLISKGLTSQRIGKTLFISKYTVETHRKNILRKLELNSSTELVKFALQQGLV